LPRRRPRSPRSTRPVRCVGPPPGGHPPL